jgi:hypothetical protein
VSGGSLLYGRKDFSWIDVWVCTEQNYDVLGSRYTIYGRWAVPFIYRIDISLTYVENDGNIEIRKASCASTRVSCSVDRQSPTLNFCLRSRNRGSLVELLHALPSYFYRFKTVYLECLFRRNLRLQMAFRVSVMAHFTSRRQDHVLSVSYYKTLWTFPPLYCI